VFIREVLNSKGVFMAVKKKFSIIVFSGDYDKAFAAFTIASGAAALRELVG
jgi:hypothetical protein